VKIALTIEVIKKHFETNNMLLTRGVEILNLLQQDVSAVQGFECIDLDWEHGEEMASVYTTCRIDDGELYENWFKFPLVYLTMSDKEILEDKKRRDEEYIKFLEEQRKLREEQEKRDKEIKAKEEALAQEKKDRELYEQLKKRFGD
jgi:hypothetical protein